MQRFFFILFLSLSIKAFSQKDSLSGKKLVYKFDIKEMIAPAIWRKTMHNMDQAHKMGADYIIIHINTYGGLVESADSIRTKILNSKIPVYAFIDKNAASAGALISIACDRIYMSPGASIGAATVVNQSGEVVPDKFQSYMRSTMRATAEAHGKDTLISGIDTTYKWKRDPLIAEAMVDPRTYIKGIIDTGKVLTFTTSEAIKNNYCEGQANSVEEVLKKAGIKNYNLHIYKPTALDKIIGFFLSPALQGILIMLIIGGIYFELQTPGVGFPLAASIIAAILYFSPLYLEGLAEHWEMLLFIGGIILLAVEIFVIPGFGIAGIGGITLMVAGLSLSMVDNVVFEMEEIGFRPLANAFLLVTLSLLLSVVFIVIISKRIISSPKLSSALFLQATQLKEKGFISSDQSFNNLINKEGTVVNMLRPSGKIEIEGNIYDAIAETGFIDKNEKVKVIKTGNTQLYVRKL